jgi:hypothetical protein
MPPKRIIVQLIHAPNPMRDNISWLKRSRLLLSVGLIISETLPFMDNPTLKSYNGIFHSLKQALESIS